MKKFFKIFGVLFILLFQFTSCFNYDNNKVSVYYFYDEPAVVDLTGDYPLIRNQFDVFYAPGVANDSILKAGDLLWTSFIVDLDNDMKLPSVFSRKYYIAENFKYKIVNSAKVIIPESVEEFESLLSDEYTDSVHFSVLYRYAIDSLWFFGFKHKDSSNQLHYTYELILNPEIEKDGYNSPTLYIRSKQVNEPDVNQAKDEFGRIVFAFDVADFVNYYRKEISPSGLVKFNLKYKRGVNADGKDIYREFASNPITWSFNKAKP